MASQVRVNWSASPERLIFTPSGSPCFSSAGMTFWRRMSIAASSAIALVGLISNVTVRVRSVWRISVAPDVTSTRASDRTGTIFPDGVTTGMLSIPWVVRMPRFGRSASGRCAGRRSSLLRPAARR